MKLTAPARRALIAAITNHPVLTGNQKVHGPGAGVTALSNALASAGFVLDMVSGDLLLGDKGYRHLSFRAALPEGSDPFSEGEEIENSRIAFAWENLGNSITGDKRVEIVAYAS